MNPTGVHLLDPPNMDSFTERFSLEVWRTPEDVLAHFDDGSDVIWVDAEHHPTRQVSIVGWGSHTLSAYAVNTGEVAAALATLSTQRLARGALGWYGWLGYGVGIETLGLRREISDAILDTDGPPDLNFLWVDHAIVFDHRRRNVSICTDRGHEAWRSAVVSWFQSTSRRANSVGPPPRRTDAVWADSDDRYVQLVERCKDFISAGEVFQLCLTTSATVHDVADDISTYRRLRKESPAPHGMFVRIASTSVLSSSPEQFVRIDKSRTVSSSPIKGTRPRHHNPERDRELETELRESEKERAENAMIVDLVRNDLNKVCITGSVKVSGLFDVKSYAQVHQLVSTINGTIRPEIDAITAISSCFPAGSMTGAPKQRAVELLASLENKARGIYAGAMGWIGPDGQANLAIVIRTIVIRKGKARIGVGGGITILSDAQFELQEVKLKARALLASLGSR